MTAKEYVSRTFSIRREIETALEEIRVMESMTVKCTSVITGMPHPPGNTDGGFEVPLAALMDSKKRLTSLIQTLQEERESIATTIQQIPDVDNRCVMNLRYLCYKSWDEIADTLGYSCRSILRKHGEALRQLEHIIKKIS